MKQLTIQEIKRLRHFAKCCDIIGDESITYKYKRYVKFCNETAMPQISRSRFYEFGSQIDKRNLFYVVQSATDKVRRFTNERLTLDADNAISKPELHAAYEAWAGQAVSYHKLMVLFNQMLREDKHTDRIRTTSSRNGIKGRYFKGVAFK